jgi:hypothetical protein
MFCPKCATQNVEGASYCRNCGANVRFVPQALNGQLPTSNQEDSQYLARRAPSMDRAIRRLTMGIVLAVMIALTSTFALRTHWWFWLLVPAMLMFARGFAEVVRVQGARNRARTALPPELNSSRALDLPAAKTEELMTPVPSVVEGTTRHLDSKAR